MNSSIAIFIGTAMILVFMYLKQKPKKEGRGFFSYIFNLLAMAFLLFMGGGLIIVGITKNFESASKEIKKEKALTPQSIEEVKPSKTVVDKAMERARELALTKEQENNSNRWHTSVTTSQIDDTTTITTTAISSQKIKKDFGYAKPVMMFTCNKRKLEVYINWDMFIGLQQKDVTIRLDKNPATSSSWTASTDGKATFSRTPQSFARKLLNSNLLTVQVTPFSKVPVVTVFDISNFENEIFTLREKCKF
jgi:type VI secretion system protein VasI